MSTFDHPEAFNVLSRVTVNGDKARLEQVLRNFVSNALKFTPNGGRVEVCASVETIDVSTNSVIEDRRDYLRIQVIDSGPGISKVRDGDEGERE